jgi:1-acyl-sn-glycerol-3-phosphate acyltransferase
MIGKLMLGWRLARVVLHVLAGLATCACVFPWLGERRRNALVQRWSRQLVGLCGVRIELAGTVAPLANAAVVANHVSWLDIFVMNAVQPSRFVAKAEIRDWPVLGWLADKAGTIFIARGSRRDLRHLFKDLVARLRAGERVAFFPEGTTCAQGGLLPFHANLFEAAIDAPAPVQPYALQYYDRNGALHPAVDFIGDTSFAESLVAILSQGPIVARLEALPPLPAAGQHRRELAAAAHAAVAAALGLAESRSTAVAG